jgi:hypothetical protein
MWHHLCFSDSTGLGHNGKMHSWQIVEAPVSPLCQQALVFISPVRLSALHGGFVLFTLI